MPTKTYRYVAGRMHSEEEKKAFTGDEEKIKKIQSEYDLNRASDLVLVYKKLQSGAIRFETSLGQAFDDAVFDAYKALSREEREGKTAEREKKGKAAPKKERISLDSYDESMQEMIVSELKKSERKRKAILVLCAFLGIASIAYVAYDGYRESRSERRWDALSDLIGSNQLSSSQNESGYVSATLSEEEYDIPEVLDKYKTLYNSNRNLIGWVKIDDTIIDYPVMQCDDNTYYLNHNFDQEEDSAGAIFLDCSCDVIRGNDNYILYGHHLASGRMFAALENYESERFFEGHRYITFDTIYEEQTFEVMYVFRSRVYNEEDVVFKYYQFIDANSEEEFISYMNEMAEMSFYDTGVTASYGDTLLTLSTCDYNENNGRFVVVAKRIR